MNRDIGNVINSRWEWVEKAHSDHVRVPLSRLLADRDGGMFPRRSSIEAPKLPDRIFSPSETKPIVDLADDMKRFLAEFPSRASAPDLSPSSLRTSIRTVSGSPIKPNRCPSPTRKKEKGSSDRVNKLLGKLPSLEIEKGNNGPRETNDVQSPPESSSQASSTVVVLDIDSKELILSEIPRSVRKQLPLSEWNRILEPVLLSGVSCSSVCSDVTHEFPDSDDESEISLTSEDRTISEGLYETEEDSMIYGTDHGSLAQRTENVHVPYKEDVEISSGVFSTYLHEAKNRGDDSQVQSMTGSKLSCAAVVHDIENSSVAKEGEDDQEPNLKESALASAAVGHNTDGETKTQEKEENEERSTEESEIASADTDVGTNNQTEQEPNMEESANRKTKTQEYDQKPHMDQEPKMEASTLAFVSSHNTEGDPVELDVRGPSRKGSTKFQESEDHAESETESPESVQESDCSVMEKRRVSFGTAQVRWHERVLEVHPCTSSGPSVGIGWEYYAESEEELFHSCTERKKKFVLSRHDREDIVLDLGYSTTSIAKAIRKNTKLKNRRRRTINNLNTSVFDVEKVEYIAETAQRKIRRFHKIFRMRT